MAESIMKAKAAVSGKSTDYDRGQEYPQIIRQAGQFNISGNDFGDPAWLTTTTVGHTLAPSVTYCAADVENT